MLNQTLLFIARRDNGEKLSSSRQGLTQSVKDILDQMLIALLTRGHTLLVGVPGLAKTLLIKSNGRNL